MAEYLLAVGSRTRRPDRARFRSAGSGLFDAYLDAARASQRCLRVSVDVDTALPAHAVAACA